MKIILIRCYCCSVTRWWRWVPLSVSSWTILKYCRLHRGALGKNTGVFCYFLLLFFFAISFLMEPSQSRDPTGGSWIDKGIYCWAKWNLISLSRKTGALWKQIHGYLTKYLQTQLYHSLLFVEMRTTLVFTQKSYPNSCMGPREQKLIGKQQITARVK